MIPPSDDPLAQRLASLPDTPLDPRVSAAVRRKARAALDEGRGARWSRLWAGVVLPAVMVGCAVLYAVDSVQFLERTYVATAGR